MTTPLRDRGGPRKAKSQPSPQTDAPQASGDGLRERGAAKKASGGPSGVLGAPSIATLVLAGCCGLTLLAAMLYDGPRTNGVDVQLPQEAKRKISIALPIRPMDDPKKPNVKRTPNWGDLKDMYSLEDAQLDTMMKNFAEQNGLPAPPARTQLIPENTQVYIEIEQ